MSPTIIANRVSAPIVRAATSTLYKTMHTNAEIKNASNNSWRWNNLSPQTKRYVSYAVGAGFALDTYIVWTYFPHWIGMDKKQ